MRLTRRTAVVKAAAVRILAVAPATSAAPAVATQNRRVKKESFEEWVRRSTNIAEAARAKAGVKSWLEDQRLRKWRWAGHVARQEDQRWSSCLLDWRLEGKRAKRGRPKARWDEEIKRYLWDTVGAEGEDWRIFATCREEWDKEGGRFCKAAGVEQE